MCLFRTGLGWVVSIMLLGMKLHPLTDFSKRLFCPLGSPEITPVLEGTQKVCNIWIAAEHGIEHGVEAQSVSVSCFL